MIGTQAVRAIAGVTLHFRQMPTYACAVCGADLSRAADAWWLRNTWTADRPHFLRAEEELRTCGSLPPVQRT